MSSRLTGSTVQAGSRTGSSVRISNEVWRSVWLASMISWLAGRRSSSRRGPTSRRCVASSCVDLARHLHPGGGQHHQVVAHPLEVADQMRGQHHADLVVGHHLHEVAQELTPGQGVEAGHRLVEHQQLGPLGDGQREGQLGPLAARQRAGALVRVEVEVLDAAAEPGRRPRSGSGATPSRRWSATAQPGVGGRVLGHETDLAELRGRRPGVGPGPRWCRHVGASSPTARCSSVVLPAPLGPTSPTTWPDGMARVQSLSAVAPVALGQPVGLEDGGHATPGSAEARKQSWKRSSMLSSSRPAMPGLGQPAVQVGPQRSVGGQRRVAQRSR